MSPAIFLTSSLLLFSGASATADGLLDPTFGVGGRLSYPFDEPTTNWHDFACSAAVQSGQRLVLAGFVRVSGGTGDAIGLVRLLPDGSVDSSFGSSGERIVPDFEPQTDDCLRIVARPDDVLLVAVNSWANAPTLLRLNAVGALDAGFDGDGILTVPHLSKILAVAVHPDSSIWVAGGESGAFKIVRLSSSGSVLAHLAVDFLAGSGTANALAVQPDGKVVACGGEVFSGSDTDFVVARFTSAGALDTSFSGDGKVTVPFDLGTAGNGDVCTDVGIDPEGRVVLLGSALNSGVLSYSFAFARLTPAGALDAGFGGSGKATIPSSLWSGFRTPRLLVQSDSKLVAASTAPTQEAGNSADVLVHRLTKAGGLDQDFGVGNGGIFFDQAPDGPGDEGDWLVALVGQGGRTVVVGSGEFNGADWDFSASRLTSSLIFASSFGDGSTSWWSKTVP